jgi:hypothetical protein
MHSTNFAKKFAEHATWCIDIPPAFLDTEDAIASRGGGLDYLSASAPLKGKVDGE